MIISKVEWSSYKFIISLSVHNMFLLINRLSDASSNIRQQYSVNYNFHYSLFFYDFFSVTLVIISFL